MSISDAIASSTSTSTSTKTAIAAGNRKSAGVSKDEERPRNNSPAFQAYEDKKNACDARIADIRARIVILEGSPFIALIFFSFRTLSRTDIQWLVVRI